MSTSRDHVTLTPPHTPGVCPTGCAGLWGRLAAKSRPAVQPHLAPPRALGLLRFKACSPAAYGLRILAATWRQTLSSGQPPAVTPRSSPPPSDPEWEPAGIERLAVVATDRFASPGTATGSLSRKAPSNLRLQLQHKLHVSATTDTDGVPKRRPGGDVLSGTDWMRGSESTREVPALTRAWTCEP